MPTSRYVEQAPTAFGMASHLACVWLGQVGDDNAFTDRILPDGCLDVIWDGQRLFAAGPDTTAVERRNEVGSFTVGVRFRPGHASPFLGVPASELLDQRVDMSELWPGATADRLTDELAALAPAEAARHLERHISCTVIDDAGLDAIDAVRREIPYLDVESLAADLGLTSRTLHRRCVKAFGYSAKTLQRVLRFRRFLALAGAADGLALASLAAESGYADQPHLNREAMRLSGLTPVELVARHAVRSVQDGHRPSMSR